MAWLKDGKARSFEDRPWCNKTLLKACFIHHFIAFLLLNVLKYHRIMNVYKFLKSISCWQNLDSISLPCGMQYILDMSKILWESPFNALEIRVAWFEFLIGICSNKVKVACFVLSKLKKIDDSWLSELDEKLMRNAQLLAILE